MKRLLINARESEKRMALIEDKQIQRLYIEQPEQQSLLRNIYIGIVEKIMPSMDAAFINIGKGKKGYLQLSQSPANMEKDDSIKTLPKVNQSDKMIVQVIKDETDTKYYRLTRNIELSDEMIVYMPYGYYVAASKKLPNDVRNQLKMWAVETKKEAEGILFRTRAEKLTKEEFVTRLNQLRAEFQQLEKLADHLKAPAPIVEKNLFFEEIKKIYDKEEFTEIICDDSNLFRQLKTDWENRCQLTHYKGSENIFSHFMLDDQLDTLQKRVVWLDNGANIVIEENEAFTVIDVNTAKSPSYKLKRDTITTTNRLAAKEIARQVRLRNIGGNILIDFINMRDEKDRKAIIQLLKEEFARDYERTIIYGFTALGILEMSRKRTKPSLLNQMTVPCATCHGTGFVESAATSAFRLERELWAFKNKDFSEVVIEATEDVINYFSGENKHHLENLEKTLHFLIKFEQVEFHKPHYYIKRFVR